eukprot:c14016_g1_i1.p1 GENE.c14016_g1_i1~~c14016_g1_i1.p1  ORF type:complete len:202 (+),score=56.42 c14016_g1_i1:71-676(+)
MMTMMHRRRSNTDAANNMTIRHKGACGSTWFDPKAIACTLCQETPHQRRLSSGHQGGIFCNSKTTPHFVCGVCLVHVQESNPLASATSSSSASDSSASFGSAGSSDCVGTKRKLGQHVIADDAGALEGLVRVDECPVEGCNCKLTEPLAHICITTVLANNTNTSTNDTPNTNSTSSSNGIQQPDAVCQQEHVFRYELMCGP